MRNAITSLENLEKWFKANQNSYWTLYHGEKQLPSAITARNESIQNMDESFDLLKQNIEMTSEYAGGIFHVFTCDKPKHNVGMHAIVAINQYEARGMQPAGVGSLQQTYIPGGIQNIEKYIKEQVESATYIQQLESKLELLEDALEENQTGGALGRIAQTISTHPQLPTLIDVIMGFFIPKSTVSISGFNQQAQQPQGTEHTEENDQQEFYNRLDAVLQTFQKHFHNPLEILEKLAKFVESNPDMAKMYLNNLK